MMNKIKEWLKRKWEEEQAKDLLSKMTDYQLADIGITRTTINTSVRMITT